MSGAAAMDESANAKAVDDKARTERRQRSSHKGSGRSSGSVREGGRSGSSGQSSSSGSSRRSSNDPVVNRVQFEIKMGLSEIKHKESMTRYRGLVHLIKQISSMDKSEIDALVQLQKTPSLDIVLAVMSATFVEFADGEGATGSGGHERVAAMHLLEGLCLMDPFFAQRLGSVKGVELLTSYVMGKQSRIPARFDAAIRERIRIAACWVLMALLCKLDKNCQTFISIKGPGKLASIIGYAAETKKVRVAVVMALGMLMVEDIDFITEWRKKLVVEVQLAVALLPGHGRVEDIMDLGRRSLDYQNNGGEDVRDSKAMNGFLRRLDTVDV